MAEDRTKGVSSHIADAFFQIEKLKDEHILQQVPMLSKLEKSVNAIAREVYQLKHGARELQHD
jgi:hypothetical protein